MRLFASCTLFGRRFEIDASAGSAFVQVGPFSAHVERDTASHGVWLGPSDHYTIEGSAFGLLAVACVSRPRRHMTSAEWLAKAA